MERERERSNTEGGRITWLIVLRRRGSEFAETISGDLPSSVKKERATPQNGREISKALAYEANGECRDKSPPNRGWTIKKEASSGDREGDT